MVLWMCSLLATVKEVPVGSTGRWALALAAVSAAAALGISCSSCCCCSEPVDYVRQTVVAVLQSEWGVAVWGVLGEGLAGSV